MSKEIREVTVSVTLKVEADSAEAWEKAWDDIVRFGVSPMASRSGAGWHIRTVREHPLGSSPWGKRKP